MQEDEGYRRAKKRVEARVGFYIHAAVYAVVNFMLIVINLSTSTEYLWFRWPLIGWGIGLGFHYLGTHLFYEFSNIKDRMIQKELEKEKKRGV